MVFLASVNKEPNHSILCYIREIDLLAKWKVVPLGSLHQLIPQTLHKTYSYRLADQLVKAGVAHKIKCLQSKFHVLVPTEYALNYTGQEFSFSRFVDYCRIAFVASAFLELPAFNKKVIRFSHEVYENELDRNRLSADFSIDGIDSKYSAFRVGVFFETLNYSRENTIEWIMKLVENDNFDVIILVFKNLEDLNIRKNLYFENRNHKYGKALKESVCLLHINDYLKHPHEINQSYAYFRGEESTLEKVFK